MYGGFPMTTSNFSLNSNDMKLWFFAYDGQNLLSISKAVMWLNFFFNNSSQKIPSPQDGSSILGFFF